jgi:hypothetical protein
MDINWIGKSEMHADFWTENPKGVFETRERASLQDNFKSYLMGVALKILGLRSRYRMFSAMVSLLFLMPEMCLHKNQNAVNFR